MWPLDVQNWKPTDPSASAASGLFGCSEKNGQTPEEQGRGVFGAKFNGNGATVVTQYLS